VRFAFWGAEEDGLLGSRHHVNALSEGQRREIKLYVNLDMVGSVNFARFVQGTQGESGSLAATATRLLADTFRTRGLAVDERSRGGRRGFGTDDASFAQAGIPTVGLYTGAGEAKSAEMAARFGGTAGQPYDPCYHRACDTVANIDRSVLEQMTDALAHTIATLSRDAP
jgi:Zn-dependent M28 family amino/carboxypeptidase